MCLEHCIYTTKLLTAILVDEEVWILKRLISVLIVLVALMFSSSVVFATELPFVPDGDGTIPVSSDETAITSTAASETSGAVATTAENAASSVPFVSAGASETTNSTSSSNGTTSSTNSFMGADGEVVYIEEEVGDSVEDMNSTLETVTSSDASIVSDDASSAVVTIAPVDSDNSSSNGISMFVAVMAVFVIVPVCAFVYYKNKKK